MTVWASGLFVAPCSREAARLATERWHYTHKLPAATILPFGAWWNAEFEGTAVVSRGASPNIGRPFNLTQDRVAEVTRIALRPGHVAPVSQVLSIVVRLLRRSNPGLELLISYSDQRQGHDGRGVYAACGWTCLGETRREATLLLHGREVHARTVSSKFGTRDVRWLREHVDPHVRRIDCPPKHKYALGLTQELCTLLAALAKPYPTRGRKADSGRPVPIGRDGASPIRPLLTSEAAHV